MEIKKRNRTELKSFFVKNAIPTEGEFAELIEGMVNQKDDGFAKLPGSPLSIEASGDDASQKKAINFYKNFSDANATWVLSLNPRSDPAKPATAKSGFSISDNAGNSRLFVDESTGKVGVGTVNPIQNLDVNGRVHVNNGVIQRGGAAITNTSDLGLYSQVPGNYIRIVSNAAPIRFYTDSGRGTAIRLSIEPNGDVSIPGTLSFGSSVRQMLNLYGTDYGLGVQTWTQYFRTNKNFAWFKDGSHNNAELNAGTGGIVQMVIKNGSVGIGTAAPTHQFHVRANNAVGLFESTGTHAYLRLSTNEGIEKRVEIANRPGGRLALWVSTAGDVFNITTAGNVGIGVTNPSAKLDVRGAIFAGNSDLYFTKINHNHSGIGNTAGYAAIENAKNYDALMILGRAGTDKGRSVKLWDYLQVNGKLDVTSTSTLKQENWKGVIFIDGWRNYSSSYNTASYFKDSLGIVHLKGLVKSGLVGSNRTICSLPVGYRPARRELQVVCTNPNVSGRVDIEKDGRVIPTTGNAGWISLDGITFRAV